MSSTTIDERVRRRWRTKMIEDNKGEDDWIRNPCYLLMEAETIIGKLTTWSNSARSLADKLPWTDKQTSSDLPRCGGSSGESDETRSNLHLHLHRPGQSRSFPSRLSTGNHGHLDSPAIAQHATGNEERRAAVDLR